MPKNKYEKNILEFDPLEGKDDFIPVSVHIIQCYNGSSISDYEDMLAELKKTFPLADKTNVICSKITISDYNRGGSILVYKTELSADYKNDKRLSGYFKFHIKSCGYHYA